MKTNSNNNFFDDLSPEYEKFVNRSVEISDRIEEILKRKKISQREFAEKRGKSESEVSKWLCGTHNFTIKSLAKIESVLNEDVIKIIKDKTESQNNEISYFINCDFKIEGSVALRTSINQNLIHLKRYNKTKMGYIKELSSEKLITLNESKEAA